MNPSAERSGKGVEDEVVVVVEAGMVGMVADDDDVEVNWRGVSCVKACCSD